MIAKEESGEAVIGGCVIEPGAASEACAECGTEWQVEGEREPSISSESLASTVAPSADPRESEEFEHLFEWLVELVEAGPSIPVVADHQCLEEFLPEPMHDVGSGPHWWEGIPMAVTCSPTCRDLLLAEGEGIPVSVWSLHGETLTRVSGRGPYYTGTSLLAVRVENGLSMMLLANESEQGTRPSVLAQTGPPVQLPALERMVVPGWFNIDPEVLGRRAERGRLRRRILVDIMHESTRWGAVVLRAATQEEESPQPEVVAVDELDSNAVTEAIEREVSLSGGSLPRRAIEVRVRWALRAMRRTSKPTRPGSFVCLHPAVVGDVCERCGRVCLPMLEEGLDDHPHLRHYGLHNRFRLRVATLKYVVVDGASVLPGPTADPEVLSRVGGDLQERSRPQDGEEKAHSKPDMQSDGRKRFADAPIRLTDLFEAKSGGLRDRYVEVSERPELVIGHPYGVGVVITAERARSLAAAWTEALEAKTFEDLVAALPSHMATEFERVFSESYRDVHGMDAEIPPDLPVDPTVVLQPMEGSSIWPWLDGETYLWETRDVIRLALPKETLDALEASWALRRAQTPDGTRLHTEDSERLMSVLSSFGVSCWEDQDLLRWAAGPCAG